MMEHFYENSRLQIPLQPLKQSQQSVAYAFVNPNYDRKLRHYQPMQKFEF